MNMNTNYEKVKADLLAFGKRNGACVEQYQRLYMVRNPQREILAYLLAGGRLTVQKAIQMFDTTELRRIVSRLRDRGFPVIADRQCGETKTGRRVWFNEYRMGHDLGGLQ